jgi:hypothetical protein
MEELSQNPNEDLKQASKLILKAEYLKFFDIWASTATKNELKGLKVIKAILKHQGKKRFKPKKQSEDQDIINTAEEIRKKYMKSYYKSEYCSNSILNNPETDILKYKNLNELKSSEVLNKDALAQLESWLGLGDDKYYQALMLAFLRGVYSVSRTQAYVPVSSHRDNFNWRTSSRNRSVMSTKDSKPVQSLSVKTRAKSIEADLQTKPAPIQYNPIGHKLRNLQDLKGNGGITNWISNIPANNTSLYQDSFTTQSLANQKQPKKDLNTSMVFKLIPNKY